ncbi:MAG: hypothetical protein KIT73_14840 [Burkholderiales bacterium]|nr:hypothetical protein [Burkholderiales bacterium]
MTRRLYALLLAIALAFPLGGVAREDRDTKIDAFVASQRLVRLPFAFNTVLPFVVAASLDERLFQAGQREQFGPEWNRQAPEWHALELRSDAIAADLVRELTEMATSEGDARSALNELANDDLDALLHFQRSELMARIMAAADLAIAGSLLNKWFDAPLPPELKTRHGAIVAEYGRRREAAFAITAEDQETLRALGVRPGVAAALRATQMRLAARAAAHPRAALEARLDAEVTEAVEEFRRNHP